MKKINQKLWVWYFTHIMGVEFIPNSPDIKVNKPFGVFMFEREVLFGTMLKTESGNYRFNKPQTNG
jgi:hypothetical protein